MKKIKIKLSEQFQNRREFVERESMSFNRHGSYPYNHLWQQIILINLPLTTEFKAHEGTLYRRRAITEVRVRVGLQALLDTHIYIYHKLLFDDNRISKCLTSLFPFRLKNN